MANKRGWWKLSITNVDDDEHMGLSDCDREHIGRCIIKGYTEGEIVKDESEDEEVK
ncbi:MAG: hypothetical protein Q8L71_06785 [Thiobacillus sp.]|nr:hypothetical protein [Thiobacillus sp.]